MNKVGKRFLTHRLVWQAFNGWISSDRKTSQINHIDGNKQNNHLTNLELVTAKENCAHAIYKLGRGRLGKTGYDGVKGEQHHAHKLTEVDVLDIRKSTNGMSVEGLAELYGVHVDTIKNVIRYKTWRHLP